LFDDQKSAKRVSDYRSEKALIDTDPLLSSGELLALTGVSQDVLTFWLRHKLIQAAPKRVGRGAGMRFAFYEANIAAIMLQLRNLGSNIDAMKGIAGIYREAIDWGQKARLNVDEAMALISLMNGPAANQAEHLKRFGNIDWERFEREVEVLRDGVKGHFKLTDRVIDYFKSDLDYEQYRRHAIGYAQIMSRPAGYAKPTPTYFWRNNDVWRRGDGEVGQLRASLLDEAFATIALDVVGILSSIWSPPKEGAPAPAVKSEGAGK
jgi:DNA-binding transcriptional MerR regulator